MPRTPQIPETLEERPVLDSELDSGEVIGERRLVDCELEDLEFRGIDFRELELERGSLASARFERGGFLDARLRATNLANLRAIGSSLHRVELAGCRMTGLQWADGVWRDVLVRDSRADLLSLRSSRLDGVTFRDCDLSEADFSDARLREVRLERCRLSGADLSGARFERCTLEGCELDGVRLPTRLTGVTMPWPDVVASAGVFAAALGVRVADEDEPVPSRSRGSRS